MSGAEVAGLVLGSIPLVISGLEHYGEGLRTMKRMWNAARHFKKLKIILELENQVFSNLVIALLKEDVEARILADLTQNLTDASKWTHPEIDACLRRRLSGSYGIFLKSAKAIADTVQDFQKVLKLDKNGKGPFDANRSSVREAITSFQFGLNLKEYGDMMSEITASNERLERLAKSQTEISSLAEPTHPKAKRSLEADKAREYAKTVFSIFQAHLSSGCQATHTASLYMKGVGTKGKSRRGHDETALRMVVHHHAPGIPSSLWSIQEAELRLLDKMTPPTPNPPNARKSVHFNPPSTQSGTAVLPEPTERLEEIQNVCERFQRLHVSQHCSEICFGYLKEHTGQSKHGLYRPRTPFVEQNSSVLTLAQILNEHSGHSLGFADRKYLACGLATGMLRLYHTPWLASQWGRDEVILFKTSRGIQASHPFISASIPTGPLQIPTSSSSTQGKYFVSCGPIKNDTLFALGLLLIEVALNQPFNQLSAKFTLNSNPDGSKNELSDFVAANGLLGEVERQAGPRYGDVVQRCISCNFGQKLSSLDDAAFRAQVEAGILLELQQEVDDLDNL